MATPLLNAYQAPVAPAPAAPMMNAYGSQPVTNAGGTMQMNDAMQATNLPSASTQGSVSGSVSGSQSMGGAYGYGIGAGTGQSSGQSTGSSQQQATGQSTGMSAGQSTGSTYGQSTGGAFGQGTGLSQGTSQQQSQASTQIVPGMLDVYQQLLGKNEANYGNILNAYTQGNQRLAGTLPGVAAGYGGLQQGVANTLGQGGDWGVATPAAQAIGRTYAQARGNTTQQMINAGLGNTSAVGNAQAQNALQAGQQYGALGAQLADKYAGYQSQIGLAQQAAAMQGIGMQNQTDLARGAALASQKFANTAGDLTGQYSTGIGQSQNTAQNQQTSGSQQQSTSAGLNQSTQGSQQQSTNQSTQGSQQQASNQASNQNWNQAENIKAEEAQSGKIEGGQSAGGSQGAIGLQPTQTPTGTGTGTGSTPGGVPTFGPGGIVPGGVPPIPLGPNTPGGPPGPGSVYTPGGPGQQPGQINLGPGVPGQPGGQAGGAPAGGAPGVPGAPGGPGQPGFGQPGFGQPGFGQPGFGGMGGYPPPVMDQNGQPTFTDPGQFLNYIANPGSKWWSSMTQAERDSKWREIQEKGGAASQKTEGTNTPLPPPPPPGSSGVAGTPGFIGPPSLLNAYK